MKNHIGKIIVAIILANIGIVMMIPHLPIPPGQGAEVYYSPLVLKQAIVNLGFALGMAYAKQWKVAAAFGCCFVLTFLIAASA